MFPVQDILRAAPALVLSFTVFVGMVLSVFISSLTITKDN